MKQKTLFMAVIFAVSGLIFIMASRRQPKSMSAGTLERPNETALVSKAGGPATQLKPLPFHWSQIESTNYDKYINDLTGIGCPRQTIVDIIVAEVNHLYRQKASNALTSVVTTNKYEFWRTTSFLASKSNVLRPYMRQLEMLDSERRALLSRLLGMPFSEEDFSWVGKLPTSEEQRLSLDYLSPEKRATVQNLLDDANAKMAQVRAAQALQNRTDSTLAVKEIEKFRSELDAHLAALLSPEEKLMHDLRCSPLAQTMRRELDGLNLSEEQFFSLFQIRKAFADQWDAAGQTVAANDKSLAEKARDEKIKEILGVSTYANYAQFLDPAYQSMSAFAQRQGVSRETIQQVLSMKSSAEADANLIRQDPSLDPQTRQQALAAIRQGTQVNVANAMGPTAWQTYEGHTASGWLNRLEATSVDKSPGNMRTSIVPVSKRRE